MNINPDVYEILKEFKIDKSAGLLCLLGFYYNLDVETTCPENVIQQINLTKIVEKDYENNSIQWNIPLFEGQNTEWEWVKEFVDGFGKINPERRGSPRDAVARMKDFFKKYPEYRKEDVMKARDLYFATQTDRKFLMKSHKFIFDGIGAMKKSTLLEYCEKVKTGSNPVSNMKGRIVT